MDLMNLMNQFELAEDIHAEIFDKVNQLSPRVFASFIGAISDDYEARHEGFSTVEMFKALVKASEFIHKEKEKKEEV